MSDTLEYLRGLSDGSKEAFMLRQLDLAAEFRKSLHRDMDRWAEAMVNAEIASLVLRGEVALTKSTGRLLET
jgi:hypothetical protein